MSKSISSGKTSRLMNWFALIALLVGLLPMAGVASASEMQYAVPDEIANVASSSGGNYEIRLKSRTFTPEPGIEPALLNQLKAAQPGERIHVLMQFDDIPTEAERRELTRQGVNLLGYIPHYAWFASVSRESTTLDDVLDGTSVRWIGSILQQDKAPGDVLNGQFGGWAITADGQVLLALSFFEDVSLANAEQIVADYGAVVEDRTPISNKLSVRVDQVRVAQLFSEDSIRWLDHIPPPAIVNNDGVRDSANVNVVQAAPYNLSGLGVTVGVWDGGAVDWSHDDFGDANGNSRVISRTGAIADHATHVAGTLAGNGAMSQSDGGSDRQWRGVAPEASIVSYDFVSPINDYAEALTTYGINLSQNSWGRIVAEDRGNCDDFGDYRYGAPDFDRIVVGQEGKKIPVLFAVGNDRRDGDCGMSSTDPYINYGNVAPPATAKNAISVGAINSNDQSMTDFSNWGPVDDGRLKPEVVAPGCQVGGDGGITSTVPNLFIDIRPRGNPPGDGVDDYDFPYDVMCGTSMAAPVVSGISALLIEQYRSTYGTAPIPSTIKALLVNTARDLNDTSNTFLNLGPDYASGYGLVDAQAAVDAVLQRRAIANQRPIRNSEVHTYTLQVPGGTQALAITLAWDDPASQENADRALVNNLDLTLIDPGGVVHYPWTLEPNNPSADAVNTREDDLNPLEQINVQGGNVPAGGTWRIRVEGSEVPYPQLYSLVVTGGTATPEFGPPDTDDRKVILIAGFSNHPLENADDDVDPSETWQDLVNFLNSTSVDSDVTTAYLVERLQREGLDHEDIILFSYTAQYEEDDNSLPDYSKPLFKRKDTEPCPSRNPAPPPALWGSPIAWLVNNFYCPADSGTERWDAWADHINELIDQFPTAQFEIIGHSNGGALTAYWAAREAQNGRYGRLDRVNGIITMDSPLKGWIRLGTDWVRIPVRFYSNAARDIIGKAPTSIPAYNVSDTWDLVVPPSEAVLSNVWMQTEDHFGGDVGSGFHTGVLSHPNVMGSVAEAMNAGQIVRPFTDPAYSYYSLAFAGRAEEPESLLRPNVEMVKPSYIPQWGVPDVRSEIGTETATTRRPVYSATSLRTEVQIEPPKQTSDGLYDLRTWADNAHIPSDSLMAESVLYSDERRAGLDVVLILDRSGSMYGDKFTNTKEAAKLFVDLMGESDKLGIVSFESTAATVPGFGTLQPIDDAKRQEAKAAIDALVTADLTALGQGLQKAVGVLDRSASDGKRVFVLLTDGGENRASCWLPGGMDPSQVSPVERQVLQSGAVVYTIALGQLDRPSTPCADGDPDARLLDIAQTTNGQYAKANKPDELLAVYNRIFNEASGRQAMVDERVDLAAGEVVTRTVQVAQNASEVVFFVSWPTGNNVDVTITAPSGPISSTMAGVYHIVGPNYEVYNISQPEAGTWTLRIEGVSLVALANGKAVAQGVPIDIGIGIIDDLLMKSEFDTPSNEYRVLDPIGVTVILQDENPIGDAVVIANVSIPTATVKSTSEIETRSVQVRLYDDGAHDDGAAGDGLYHGVFDDTVIPGSYIFDVTASGNTSNGDEFQRTDRIVAVVTAYDLGQNPPADLSFMVTRLDATPIEAGAVVSYCVSYANAGPAEAKTAGAYLFFPEDMSMISSPEDNRVDGPMGALWAHGDIEVGEHGSTVVGLQVADGISVTELSEVIVTGGSGISTTMFYTESERYSPDRNLRNDFAIASGEVAAKIDIQEGWNLFSVPIESGGIHPSGLLCNLMGDYDVVLGFDDMPLTFDPNLPGKFSTLQQMYGTLGYWVKSGVEQTIPISAERLDPATELPLKQGWNLISYLPETTMVVTDALSSILGQVEVVLGYDQGATSFYTDLPPQLSTLRSMESGKGYWVKLSNPATLQYPTAPAVTKSALEMQNRPQSPAGVVPTNQWINVYSLNSAYNGEPLPIGTVVTAIGEDGRKLGEVEVSETGWYGVLSVYRDDGYTAELDGARRGEAISFLINGQPATIVNGVSPTWTSNGDLLEVNLAASGSASHSRPMYLPLIQR